MTGFTLFEVNGSRFSIFPGSQPNRSSPEILPDSCARSNIFQPDPLERHPGLYSGSVTSEPQAFPANRQRSWALLAIVVGMVLVGIAADYWYRYTGTPEYSLSQLGKAVKAKNYGAASQFVNEERIAGDISESLTDVLLAKYTQQFNEDPFPFTDTRIEMLQSMAPRFRSWTLIAMRNAIRLLLSGNGILTGTSGFKQLDVHNFSQLHVVRSEVHGDTADVIIAGLPQPNPIRPERNPHPYAAHPEFPPVAHRAATRRNSHLCEIFRSASVPTPAQ